MENNDNATVENKKSPRKRRVKKSKMSLKKKILIVLLNFSGMAVLAVLIPYLTLLWLDKYTNHGEACEVPEVNGLELEEAAELLRRNKLDYTVIERRHKPRSVDTEVLSQHPEAGARVKEGRKVALVVNTIVKPKRSVPSVIDNRTYREAESHIKAAGFIVERIDSIPGEKDWVYKLLYNKKELVNGEAIPQGSKITVVIGNGKKRVEEDEAVFDASFGI